MAIQDVLHRRTHSLLLITKLLAQKDNISPFTLILDSLEQSVTPLFNEYIRQAKVMNPGCFNSAQIYVFLA